MWCMGVDAWRWSWVERGLGGGMADARHRGICWWEWVQRECRIEQVARVRTYLCKGNATARCVGM